MEKNAITFFNSIVIFCPKLIGCFQQHLEFGDEKKNLSHSQGRFQNSKDVQTGRLNFPGRMRRLHGKVPELNGRSNWKVESFRTH